MRLDEAGETITPDTKRRCSLERVTIIGLGLIGTSIGLALKDSGILRAEIVGHDLEPSHENKAKKMGAVDKTTHNLIDAVENSRLIILATPKRSWQTEKPRATSLVATQWPEKRNQDLITLTLICLGARPTQFVQPHRLTKSQRKPW
jgi:UDP-N-acetyl-D-mannosaminuronate dehydrogenase